MFKNGMRPIHPGEVLLEDYIKPMGVSVRALSIALHVPYSRLREIVDGKRGVSADTALRLERYFGSDAQGWLALQAAYDLRIAEKQNAKTISRQISPWVMATAWVADRQIIRFKTALPAEPVMFSQAFPIGYAARTQWSWAHYFVRSDKDGDKGENAFCV